MKIIVNNEKANSIIDTGDANIDEVFDMFIGALIQQGYIINNIYEALEVRYKEFQSLMETHYEGR